MQNRRLRFVVLLSLVAGCGVSEDFAAMGPAGAKGEQGQALQRSDEQCGIQTRTYPSGLQTEGKYLAPSAVYDTGGVTTVPRRAFVYDLSEPGCERGEVGLWIPFRDDLVIKDILLPVTISLRTRSEVSAPYFTLQHYYLDDARQQQTLSVSPSYVGPFELAEKYADEPMKHRVWQARILASQSELKGRTVWGPWKIFLPQAVQAEVVALSFPCAEGCGPITDGREDLESFLAPMMWLANKPPEQAR